MTPKWGFGSAGRLLGGIVSGLVARVVTGKRWLSVIVGLAVAAAGVGRAPRARKRRVGGGTASSSVTVEGASAAAQVVLGRDPTGVHEAANAQVEPVARPAPPPPPLPVMQPDPEPEREPLAEPAAEPPVAGSGAASGAVDVEVLYGPDAAPDDEDLFESEFELFDPSGVGVGPELNLQAGPPDDDGSSVGEAPPPPRTSYARLEADDTVVAGKAFPVTVGLAPGPTPGVVSEPLRVPDRIVGDYVLTVQLVADGFALQGGDDWRLELPVAGTAPYPEVTVELVAEAQEVPVRPRALQALFSIDGQTVGLAVRPIAVVRDPETVGGDRGRAVDTGCDIALPEGWVAPDLTVRILKGKAERAGRLLWTLETADQSIGVPHQELICDIGSEPEKFAATLVGLMPRYEGRPDLYAYVEGVADTIADQVPTEFWDVLSEVAKRSEGAPSVLILSEEAHVPWELARMDAPLDPGSPPFLSAQARVGRWVLGKRRPKMPPPMSAQARSMAVVFGAYTDLPTWGRLRAAEEEAADLQSRYGAQPVQADLEAVLDCLNGDPPSDLLHFSVHGKYDPSRFEDGLILIDGRTIDQNVVRSMRFTTPRFVFLNACQVGMGDEALGAYAGIAAAFLYAGAAGVIAPLWSIDDAVARTLALAFYEATFEGQAPAELLREKRSEFSRQNKPKSSTYIAYQFFGHPDMLFSGTEQWRKPSTQLAQP